MTVDNPVKHEVELVDKFWASGYAAFRTASQGPGTQGNADVVALKSGKVVVLNVVVLETGTSTRKIGDVNSDLVRVKRISDDRAIGNKEETVIGHAVKKDYLDEWFYCGVDNHSAKAKENYDKLYEVIGR